MQMRKWYADVQKRGRILAGFALLGAFLAPGVPQDAVHAAPPAPREPLLAHQTSPTASVAWARELCGEPAKGISSDAAGNVTVVAHFGSRCELGAGEKGAITLEWTGGSPFFVARFRPDGSLLWARAVGQSANIQAEALAVTPDGSVLVTGSSKGPVDFGIETEVIPERTSAFFLARWKADGTLTWVRRLQPKGDTSITSNMVGRALTVLPDGEVVAAGAFSGTLNLKGPPTPGNAGLTLAAPKGSATFLARFNKAGTLTNARAVAQVSDGRNGGDEVSLAALPDGRVWVAASHQGPQFVEGGVAPPSLDGGWYAARYSSKLQLETVISIPSKSLDIAADPEGGVWALEKTSPPQLVRYRATGAVAWTHALPGARQIAAQGNTVWVTGDLDRLTRFGEGHPTAITLAPQSPSSAYIARLDAQGTLAWVRQMKGSPTSLEMRAAGVGYVSTQGKLLVQLTGLEHVGPGLKAPSITVPPPPPVSIPWETFARGNPELYVQQGHGASILSIDVSADGRFILSGSADGTAKLWEASSGRELRTFRGHVTGWVVAALSPDGRFVLTGGEDKSARLWNISTGAQVQSIEGLEQPVNTVAFSRDGTRLLINTQLETLILETESWQELRRLYRDLPWPGAPIFNADGSALINGAGVDHKDRNQRLYQQDIQTGQEGVEPETCAQDAVDSVLLALSRGGRYLACGSYWLRLVDLETSAALVSLGVRDLTGLALSPDNRLLAHSSADGLQVVSPIGGEVLWSEPGGKSEVIEALTFSPDSRTLILASNSPNYDTYRIRRIDLVRKLELPPLGRQRLFQVSAMDLHMDSRRLLTADLDGQLRLWDLSSGRVLRTFSGHTRRINALVMLKKGKQALSSSDDQTLRLWDLDKGSTLQTFRGHSKPIWGADVSPDGTQIASGSDDTTVRLWDVATGKELKRFAGNTKDVNTVAFSPDGKLLLGAGLEGTVRVWEVATGAEYRRLRGESIVSARFSPDGRFVVGGGVETQALFRWELASGRQVWKVSANAVKDVQFSADGTRILTAGEEGTVCLWDAATGKQLHVLQGHVGSAEDVRFLSQQDMAVSSGLDGTLRFWDIAAGQPLAMLVLSAGALPSSPSTSAAPTPSPKAGAAATSLVLAPSGHFHYPGGSLPEFAYAVQGLQVIGLGQLYDTYFSPRLLERILRREVANPQESSSFQNLQPLPEVQFISPKVDGTTLEPCISVQLLAIDQGGGVAQLALFVNGKRVEGTASPTSSKREGRQQLEQTFKACLVKGPNVLRATASSAAGIEAPSLQRTIELTQGSSAAPGPPRLHLLAVGVSRYANARYNLTYAHLDAQQFHQTLKQDGARVFASVEPILLTDQQATRARILTELEGLVKRAAPQDVVAIFLAGHGVASEQRYYFIPHDATQMSGDALVTGAISSLQLAEFVRRFQAQKIALFLDTCHAGASLGDVGRVALRGGALIEEEESLGRLAHATGSFVLAGSTDSQLAAESNQFGHGLFTQSMLEALTGKASCTPVTVGCLQRYAEQRLPELYQAIKQAEQFPAGFRFGDDFPIAQRE